MEPIDETRRKEIASLLSLGMDPAALAKVTGIPVTDFPEIVKSTKDRVAKHRSAVKFGQDVKSVIGAAASYQEALANDPWAPVPAGIKGIVQSKVEIDPGLAGLDRRVVLVFSKRNTDALAATMFQVGIEDAWTSIDMLAGRYVVPTGAQSTEAWNLQVGWGRASMYVDMVVESMTQSINQRSLHLLQGIMDWGLWQLRADYVVRHDDVIERFDSFKHRATVKSIHRDNASSASRAIDHELASQLIHGMASGDRDSALECRRKYLWAPFISFDRTWIGEWLDRLVLVMYDPPAQDLQQLEALANLFPVATMYTGECSVWYGSGKTRARRAAVVDAFVPRSNLTIMTDHVIAVASAVTPEFVIMPECNTLTIPYPLGYPTGDITRIYKPGARRASMVQDKRLCTFDEHWIAQQAIDG